MSNEQEGSRQEDDWIYVLDYYSPDGRSNKNVADSPAFHVEINGKKCLTRYFRPTNPAYFEIQMIAETR